MRRYIRIGIHKYRHASAYIRNSTYVYRPNLIRIYKKVNGKQKWDITKKPIRNITK